MVEMDITKMSESEKNAVWARLVSELKSTVHNPCLSKGQLEKIVTQMRALFPDKCRALVDAYDCVEMNFCNPSLNPFVNDGLQTKK